MILDAEVKIGEYTLSLPKDRSFKGNQYTGKMVSNISVTNQNNKKIDEMVVDTTVYNQNNNDKEEKTSDSSVDSKNRQSNIDVTLAKNVECSPEKTSDSSVDLPSKEKIIKELCFDKMTISRFETLAKNKDLVEQVKQEARENNTNPTRTQVLNLAQAGKQMQEQKEEEYKEFCENSEKSKKIFNQLIDSLGFIRRLNNEDIELAMITLDNNLSKDIIAYIQEAQIKLALLKQEAEKYKGVKLWQEKEC